jgi:hypothetical protein
MKEEILKKKVFVIFGMVKTVVMEQQFCDGITFEK